MGEIRVTVINVHKDTYDYLVEILLHCIQCKRKTNGLVRVTRSGAVRSIGCSHCRNHKVVKVEW